MLNLSFIVVPPNTWKHIAASVDCSNKKQTSVTLFVDGKNVKEDKIVAPEREPLGIYFFLSYSYCSFFHSFEFVSIMSYFIHSRYHVPYPFMFKLVTFNLILYLL